jgi:hypothetical protein
VIFVHLAPPSVLNGYKIFLFFLHPPRLWRRSVVLVFPKKGSRERQRFFEPSVLAQPLLKVRSTKKVKS